jgi:hypothetical protein
MMAPVIGAMRKPADKAARNDNGTNAVTRATVLQRWLFGEINRTMAVA